MTYDAADASVLLLAQGSINPVRANTSTWTYAKGTWTLVNTSVAPGGCRGSSLTYDGADSEAVLFTGANCTARAQTWVFQAGIWLQLHPSRVPPARDQATFTYDPTLGSAVLFGGYNYTSACNGLCLDTWAFSGGGWTNLTSLVMGHPPGRGYAAAAFDSRDHDIVLFGGLGASGPLNDTWTFNGTAWVLATSIGSPPTMVFPLLTDDQADGYVLLAGGGYSNCPQAKCLNDTWRYASGSWTEFRPPGTPPASGEWAWTYDAVAGTVIAFGGRPTGSPSPNTGLTWTYSGGNWTNRSLSAPPPPRAGASMVYDGADGYVLLFGGYASFPGGNSYFLGDTWTYLHGNWTDLTGTLSTAPSARNGAALAYDGADGYVVLFGGESVSCRGGANPSFPVCGDTWEFVGGGWTRLTPSVAPSNRSEAGIAYDPVDGEAVLFGGSNEFGLNDTWTFRAGTWTNITVSSHSPPLTSPVSAPGLTYDAADGYLLLLGGGLNNQTWAFHGGAWTDLTGSVRGAPSADFYATLAYDPTFGVAVEFGGCGTADCTTLLDRTYTYVGSNWTAQFPPQSPSPRDGSQMAFDSADGYLVLFGGQTALGSTADLWEFGTASSTLSVRGFTSTPDVTDVSLPVALNVSTAGANGTLSFSYLNLPPGCPSQNASAIRCTPSMPGLYRVGIVVTDSTGHHAAAQLRLTVNTLPSVSSFQAVPPVLPVGNRTLLEVAVTGGTGSYDFAYSGLAPGCLSQTIPTLPCQPSTSGNYTVLVRVTDSIGGGATATLNLTVVPAGVGTAPRVSEFGAVPSLIALGNATNFSVVVVGGNAGLTFEYAGLPPGCAPANLSVLLCTPTTAGTYTVQLVVKAVRGVSTEVGTMLTVYPAGGRGHPQVEGFAATPNRLVLGNSTVFAVTASEMATVLAFSYSGLPPGCHSNNLSNLPCLPSAAGTYSVTVLVRDTHGNSTSVDTSLTVTGGRPVPGPGSTPSSIYGEFAIALVAVVVGALGVAVLLLRRRDRRWRAEGEQWIGALLSEGRSPPKKPGI
ncbi:MAG: hypothetical protein L3K14_03815 [Thermoplasmata archaeon]|nr:hypothetical protein [Thermoplasmata archaeon]